jgi:glycosyltransferase involved in cell wall biosynthesis
VRLPADIVCLSHLRWDFVYQRPNHLMARAARAHRVYFVEEPEQRGSGTRVEARVVDGVTVVKPLLPEGTDERLAYVLLRDALDGFMASEGIEAPWLWYYTPMALPWTAHVRASAVVYDCMDELSGFKFAPPQIRDYEQRLIQRADVVFTGGRSLHEAKRGQHQHTYCFPSSVDAAHFRQARGRVSDPADQAPIGRPRIGYYGVIDERIDLPLVAGVAAARPDWNLVMVGPVLKIGDDELPRADNIHWLGLKSYAELPAYLAGWDVAMMPFALNDSTRHISPTKTPEYLSGGRPVISTAINDVVHPYADEGLVHIAADVDAWVEGIETILRADRADLLRRVDRFLGSQSWDATWAQMERLVEQLRPRRPARVSIPIEGPAATPIRARQAGSSNARAAALPPRSVRK